MRTQFFPRMNALKISKRILLLTAVMTVCLSPRVAFGQTVVNDDWNGGAGNWSNPANWSNGVPNNNSSFSYNVFIDNGNPVDSQAILDISPTINNLTIDSGDTLSVYNTTQTLTIAGTSIQNSGQISVSGTTAALQLVIAGSNVTLSGSGTLSMGGSSNSSITASVAGNTLTNQSVIKGSGSIGGNGLVLVNSGTINASSPINLYVSSTDTNTGLLEATITATLVISGDGSINNTGGTIFANGGNGGPGYSTVEINGTTINGGLIEASGVPATNGNNLQGQVIVNNATINGSTLEAVPINKPSITLNNVIVNGGTLEGGIIAGTGLLNGGTMAQGAELTGTFTLTGSFVNSGDINASTISIAGSDVTFDSQSSVTGSTDVVALAAGDTLTNEGFITNSSVGQGGLILINSGTTTSTTTLYVQDVTDMNTGSLGGSIIGSGAGTSSVTNAGGTIQESTATGGKIENVTIDGGTLMGTGGTLTSAILTGVVIKGTGTFIAEGSSINGGSSTATLEVANGSSLTLADGFTSTGKIKLEAGGSTTQLLISGNLTLAGTISLSNSANNVIEGASTGTEILTNKGTLEGSGNIGNGFMGLVNTGTILANQSTPLTVDVSSAGFTNTGKLTVDAGDTLNITGPANSFTDSGTVKVTSGGTLAMGSNLNFTQTKGSITVDGTLSVAGANIINITGGTLYGNNGILEGNFSLSGTGVVSPGDGSKKIGDLTIDGTYTQGSKSNLIVDLGGTTADTGYSVLNITDAASLSGKLTVDLVNGFTPVAGDAFTILDYSSETGTFSTKILPKLSGGDTWLITYNATDVVLTVEAPAAPASASLSSVNGTPARWTRSASLLGSGAGVTHEPSAILTPAESCGGFRAFASFACLTKAFSSVTASVGPAARISSGSERSSASTFGRLHNNVAAATSGSASRYGASQAPDTRTASIASIARLYVCAYLPSEVASTMGCR